MGREARCSATFAGTTGEVKAHLDADSVRLRGAFRLDVACADIHDVQVRGETLHLRAPAGTVSLALGASEAAKWRKGILEPKSLLDKLGVGVLAHAHRGKSCHPARATRACARVYGAVTAPR